MFGMIFTSCEESLSERENRVENGRLSKKVGSDGDGLELSVSPVEAIIEEINKIVHVTYSTVSTDSSYWYVIIEDSKTRWHVTVSLPTPYFDFKVARNQINTEGDVYFKTIIQINKESVETYRGWND